MRTTRARAFLMLWLLGAAFTATSKAAKAQETNAPASQAIPAGTTSGTAVPVVPRAGDAVQTAAPASDAGKAMAAPVPSPATDAPAALPAPVPIEAVPAAMPEPVPAAAAPAAVGEPTPEGAPLPAVAAPTPTEGSPAAIPAPLTDAAQTAGTPAEGTSPAAPAEMTAPAPRGKAVKVSSKVAKPAPVACPGSAALQELPETPMLDEEGKQRLDTDGKPIFNPAIAQQRDKKGRPLFDASCKPIFQSAGNMGYTDKGKKIHVAKQKAVKTVPVFITRGTYTVDGMIAKAELNYAITDFKFVYMYAPGIGTVIVSNSPFAGATVQKGAFRSNPSPKMSTLTIRVKVGDEDHILELASEKPLLAKAGRGEPAYVQLDRDFMLPSKYPVVGYGKVERSPYAWPGGKPNTEISGVIKPPPTPVNLRPVMLLAACPTGQMRRPAPAVLPGQVAPDQPCVSIVELKKQKAMNGGATQNVTPEAGGAALPAAGETPATGPAAAVPPQGD